MTNLFKTLAATSVAAVALITPAAAFAGDYRQCNDTEAAVAGGLIGGSIGTVLGEEIAGRRDKTEGAIAGALIGGIIGAAVGDGASDCEKDGRIYRNVDRRGTSSHRSGSHNHNRVTSYPSRTTYDRPATISRVHHGSYNSRGYSRGYERSHDRRDVSQYDRRLNRLNRRIERLRAEGRELKDRRRYEGRRPWLNRRIKEVGYELDRLKDERRRLKRNRNRNDSRQSSRRGHYHGSNLCYSNH